MELKPRQAILPHIHSIIDSLQGARYFTQLDCAQAFFSVSVAEESKYLTTFALRFILFPTHAKWYTNSPSHL
jgi:Reverse transcriptase (RNA-dependent DNA polymerase)